MDAIEKTDAILRLTRCPLGLLVKNDKNPNRMSQRDFDLLVDNMQRTGWTDPALVRPSDFKALEKIAAKAGDDEDKIYAAMQKQGIKLHIVGGHHRYDGASYLGFEHGPVNVIMDPKFDEEQETFQLVRMNMIRGRLDPQAFVNLVSSLSGKYSNDVLQDAFGFAEEAEWNRLIKQTAKALPDKHAQDKFHEAAKEIKTIDGLAKLLNDMFAKYGDTLPYGFMVFDHGGQRSMWLRIEGKTMKALDVIGDICIEKGRTVDDLVGTILQLVAKGELGDVVETVLSKTPHVSLPVGIQVAPTKENLDKIAAVS